MRRAFYVCAGGVLCAVLLLRSDTTLFARGRAPTTPPLHHLSSEAATLELAHAHLERVGSVYGGWHLVPALLNSAGCTVYSVGIGKDISFDLALLARFPKCVVHGFDNTPPSNKFLRFHLRRNHTWPTWLTRRYHPHPFLLGTTDGNITLDLPTGHADSYAAVDSGGAQGFRGRQHVAPARTITSLMALLNHTRLDVLKIDIEAAEFAVLDGLLQGDEDTRGAASERHRLPTRRLPACMLLIEFHSRLSPLGYAAKAQALLSLQSLGFTLVHNVVGANGGSADNAIFVNWRFCAT